MLERQMNYMIKPAGQATYQDIEDAPEGMIAEIINGELVLQPRPAPRHLEAEGELVVDLKGHFRKTKFKPGGWLIVNEPEVHFAPSDIYDPDIAGWKTETLSELPNKAHYSTVPDWVCEIVSPSSRKMDRVIKPVVYAQHGVKHYWIIDPEARTLEVFELQDKQWVLSAMASDDDVVKFNPFPEVELELKYYWQDN